MSNDQSHQTKGAGLAVPAALSLAIAAVIGGGGGGSLTGPDYTLDQIQGVFAAMNTEPVPASNVYWASALAADEADGSVTQDGSEGNPFSLRRAIYNAAAGMQILLKDDGVYQLENSMYLSSNYDDQNYADWTGKTRKISVNMHRPANESERIVVRGAPGTCPVLDNTDYRINVESNFFTFQFLRFNNAGSALGIGSKRDCEQLRLNHICGEFFKQTGGQYNVAFFIKKGGEGAGSRAHGLQIENCYIEGNNSSSNENNSCLMLTSIPGLVVRGNYMKGCLPSVFRQKWDNDHATIEDVQAIDSIIENNVFWGRVEIAGPGDTWRNNLIVGEMEIASHGGSTGIYSQDYLTIEHNTVLGTISLSRRDNIAQFNNVKNNICARLTYDGGNETGIDSTNISDYNLLADVNHRGTVYDMAGWRALLAQDMNSIEGVPTYVGGASPTAISGFVLEAGSLGKGAANDSGDMGADLTQMALFVSGGA